MGFAGVLVQSRQQCFPHAGQAPGPEGKAGGRKSPSVGTEALAWVNGESRSVRCSAGCYAHHLTPPFLLSNGKQQLRRKAAQARALPPPQGLCQTLQSACERLRRRDVTGCRARRHLRSAGTAPPRAPDRGYGDGQRYLKDTRAWLSVRSRATHTSAYFVTTLPRQASPAPPLRLPIKSSDKEHRTSATALS